MQNPYTATRFDDKYLTSLDTRTGERLPPVRASRWERAKALLFAAALLGLVAAAAHKGYIAFATL